MTYEKPALNTVGKATDMILGIASFGTDLDGYLAIEEFQFAEDEAAR